MSKIELNFLSKEDISSLLSLDDVIETTQDVFRRFGRKEIYSPPKESLPLQSPDQPGMHWINSMPAFLEYENIVGIKWVNVTSANVKMNLPVTMGVIILNDGTTGMPIAITDGTWITHMRTGASSAIGAKLFARKDSKIMTIVGCGAEGRTNLEATARFFDFEEIRVVDINIEARDKFIREQSEKLNLNIVAYDSVEGAVKESDIIILTTSAQLPLMMAEWAKPGDYISTISCFADLDAAFIKKADKLIMDDKECATKRIRMMAGLECPDEAVYGDICEVAADLIPGRENDSEIIVYTPAGMGAVDVAVAYRAYQLSKERKIGSDLILANEV